MISHHNKFVFIHIPKNGGTSIDHALLNCGAKADNSIRGPYTHYDSISKEMAENYFIFAFHRNPWDRFVSLWQYWMIRKKISATYNLPEDFEYFCHNVNHVKSLLPEIEHVHFLTQLALNNQPSYVKPKWFDFANLNTNFEEICKTIGLKYKPLEILNKSSHKFYTEYYTNELIDLVYKIYKMDIVCFKYHYGM